MPIEIMRIFKESFHNVREHKREWLRIAYAPLVVCLVGVVFMSVVYWAVGLWSYEALLNLMKGQETYNEHPFIVIFANIVYYITYGIALGNVIISGFRYAVLKDGKDRWWILNLNWRFVKLVLYYFLIVILTGIYTLIAIGIVVGTHYTIESTALTVILGILLALYGIYLMVRIGLTFLLIAIDQEKPIRVSWRLLKGNVLRIVGLLVLIWIVLLLISLAGITVLGLLGWLLALISPWLVAIPVVLFLLFGLFMWLLSWAILSKAFALVYKTFTEGEAF